MFTPRVGIIFAFALLLVMVGSAWYSSTAMVPGADTGEPRDSQDPNAAFAQVARLAKIQELLQARLAITKELASLAANAHRAGEAPIEHVFQANQAVLKAQLDLCESNKERIAIMERFVELARDQEEHAVKSYKTGRATASAPLNAKVVRLEAEIALEKAGLAAEPGKPAAQRQERETQKPDGVPGHVGKKSEQKSAEKVLATLPGVVVPARQFRVSPKVAGQVLELLIDEGTQVKAGQVLARLERTEYELAYKHAQAQVERMQALLAEEESKGAQREAQIKQAEAAIREAAAQRNYRRAEVARLQALVRQATASAEVAGEKEAQLQVAQARLQQAESNLMMLQKAPQKERVAAAKAALAAAEAQRDLAKFRLDGTEIRAPAAGTILAKHAQVGDTVRLDAAAGGRCELADLSQLEAVVHVPETDLAKVFTGQTCEIRLPAAPSVVYQGQVSRVLPVVSPQTRTVPLRARIDVPRDDRNLRPGMSTEVRLLPKG